MNSSTVGLNDQIPLSDDELDYARRVADWCLACCRRRDMADSLVAPAAKWQQHLPHMSRHLDLMNCYDRLRLFAGHFSGWPLQRFGIGDFDLELAKRTGFQLCDHFDALCADLPDTIIRSAPARFGEVGLRHRGAIVNHDTCAYYERISLMWRAGLLADTRMSILEVGGGYGGLAYYISAILSGARYTIVDLPESLMFSAIYLPIAAQADLSSSYFDEDGIKVGRFCFVPNFRYRAILTGENYDLAINTLSMSEMSEAQVRDYAEFIACSLTEDGVFFEQNQDNTHLAMLDAKQIIKQYFGRRLPYPSAERRWQGYANAWMR
jgi:hypothetical protein